MEIIIARDKKGGKTVLTTDSPASHYGIPVLQITADDINGDFGPADIIDAGDGKLFTAADVVASWALQNERTEDERSAARKFLGQWSEGPQILHNAAATLGRKGGSSKSKAKQKASRENGKLGGYPKGRPRTKDRE